MNAAAGLLDSVVSVEWESLAEGDYKTEECIDEMESIKGGLRPSFFCMTCGNLPCYTPTTQQGYAIIRLQRKTYGS